MLNIHQSYLITIIFIWKIKAKLATHKNKISKEDAERMLDALKDKEKDLQKKLNKKIPVRIQVEKDW